MRLTEGSVFAERYRIERLIATGGMGAVYEATHLETERRRALKVMRREIVSNDDLKRRFRQEAKVAGKIDSDFVVDVFDAGIDDATGAPFLVMELLKGEELSEVVKRQGRLEPDEALVYLDQVARALDKSHQANIVHRDLKPENIFVTQRDDGAPQIKVLDFGIAKIIQGTVHGKPTRNLGTPLFMAPEQFKVGAPITLQTDVFAFGMVAFAILVGSNYWHDEAAGEKNVFKFAAKAMNGPGQDAVARSERRGVALPSLFDAWFAECTAAESTERFPSAGAALEALRTLFVAQHEPTAGVTAAPVAPVAPVVAPATVSSASDPTGAEAAPQATVELAADASPVAGPEANSADAAPAAAHTAVLGGTAPLATQDIPASAQAASAVSDGSSSAGAPSGGEAAVGEQPIAAVPAATMPDATDVAGAPTPHAAPMSAEAAAFSERTQSVASTAAGSAPLPFQPPDPSSRSGGVGVVVAVLAALAIAAGVVGFFALGSGTSSADSAAKTDSKQDSPADDERLQNDSIADGGDDAATLGIGGAATLIVDSAFDDKNPDQPQAGSPGETGVAGDGPALAGDLPPELPDTDRETQDPESTGPTPRGPGDRSGPGGRFGGKGSGRKGRKGPGGFFGGKGKGGPFGGKRKRGGNRSR